MENYMAGNEKVRMAIYAMAGFYLLSLAYQMIQGLGEVGSEKLIFVLFIIVFAGLGAFLMYYGIKNNYLLSKKETNQQNEELGKEEKN